MYLILCLLLVLVFLLTGLTLRRMTTLLSPGLLPLSLLPFLLLLSSSAALLLPGLGSHAELVTEMLLYLGLVTFTHHCLHASGGLTVIDTVTREHNIRLQIGSPPCCFLGFLRKPSVSR